MDKGKNTDPFVLKIMELTGLKEEELKCAYDYAGVAYNVESAEYAYLIGKIQYLLLKYNLEKQMNKIMSEDDVKSYCDSEQAKKSYSLRKAARYLLPSPLKIKCDIDADILPEIEKIMIEIRDKHFSNKFIQPLSETQLRKCMNLQSYANYYDCIKGSQNYFKFKNMGIEEYMKNKKEKSSEKSL